MAGQNTSRWEIHAEIEEQRKWSEADDMKLLKEKDVRILPVNHPHDDTQINRNGLI